jgi:mannose-6-phosphate isomerase-like protein (cupin superfamily)
MWMAELEQHMDFSLDAISCGADDEPRPAGELTGPRREALAPVTVRWMENTVMGVQDQVAPHRHDYHELIWIREGSGRHLLDGTPVDAPAGTITVIGRGQIHRFDEARSISGAILDFSDEALFAEHSAGQTTGQAAPAWLLTSTTSPTVTVPSSRAPGLEAVLRSLDDEARRPPDEGSADLQRHLLCTLLLWIDRWHEDATPRQADTSAARLHIRFIRQLERDFVRHHDAAYYADTLGSPRRRSRPGAARHRRPGHQRVHPGPRDARSCPPAAIHRFPRQPDRVPLRLRRPPVLLPGVQAPPRTITRQLQSIRPRNNFTDERFRLTAPEFHSHTLRDERSLRQPTDADCRGRLHATGARPSQRT